MTENNQFFAKSNPPLWVWTEGRLAHALRLAAEGKSTRKIGGIIGCTKNAVVGKLWRHRQANALPASTIEERLRAHWFVPGCRWIDGEVPGEWRWCGAPVALGSPWCAEHQVVCCREVRQ